MSEGMMTVKDISQALGVTYLTALHYIRDNRLRAVRVGGMWRISQEEFKRFCDEGNYDDKVDLDKREEAKVNEQDGQPREV